MRKCVFGKEQTHFHFSPLIDPSELQNNFYPPYELIGGLCVLFCFLLLVLFSLVCAPHMGNAYFCKYRSEIAGLCP